jgi:ABC-2 type transport system ATP-binding protein
MLEVKEVQLRYGDFIAVENLNFTLKPGEIFGLLGTNGAGKTTTFRVIMGLLEPSEGEVLYDGQPIGYHRVDDIGYMIEERSLMTKISVKELMLFFGQLKSVPKALILERLDTWLEFFGIPQYKDQKIKELSKGNQQKIQFISALINDPKLLVLDEPFSGLDPINTALFVKAIQTCQAEGKMIIFSSHQLDHVESFCEKIVVLERGKVILSGAIQAIKRDFKKQTIRIQADLSEADFKAIDGVYQTYKTAQGLEIKVSDPTVVKAVFDVVKSASNVTLFDVSAAPLSEIFIAKVGDAREQV